MFSKKELLIIYDGLVNELNKEKELFVEFKDFETRNKINQIYKLIRKVEKLLEIGK